MGGEAGSTLPPDLEQKDKEKEEKKDEKAKKTEKQRR